MARVMNVVTLGLAVLAGCMAHTGPVEDALAIADQVTTEVEGKSLLSVNAPKDKKQDTKMDPEVAYGEKHQTQADATLVEKVSKEADAKAEDDGEEASAEEVVDEEAKPTAEAQVAVDAKNAHTAAKTAKQAATVATKVAKHSLTVSEHAKDALKNAHDALHRARVTTHGLSKGQKNSLKKAEKKLKEATKDAEYGQVKDAKYAKVDVKNKELEKLEEKMAAQKKAQAKKNKKQEAETQAELEAMNKDLEELRKKLKAQGGRDVDDETIKDLQKQIKDMEKVDKKEDKADSKSHDEMKAEIERLRDMVQDLENDDDKAKTDKKTTKAKTHALPKSPDAGGSDDSSAAPAKVVKGTSIDIDTAMPYGDLEPFGREDTAQELTESSINESDQMVDQLERAEVAEEKRAVFRALTRLRGAAITSFDGVARSQTGNIDEYNKIHQWRKSHPLHHLADEESDVAKWAFPDNAD